MQTVLCMLYLTACRTLHAVPCVVVSPEGLYTLTSIFFSSNVGFELLRRLEPEAGKSVGRVGVPGRRLEEGLGGAELLGRPAPEAGRSGTTARPEYFAMTLSSIGGFAVPGR